VADLDSISPSNNTSTLYSTMWCHLSCLTIRKTRTLVLPYRAAVRDERGLLGMVGGQVIKEN
jgi:hypothetical protein